MSSEADQLFTPTQIDKLFPRRYNLEDAQLRVCIDGVVEQNMPGATGRFVPSQERHPMYRVFGDMLTYRQRGTQEVRSLSIGWSGDSFATTRIATLVLPVDALRIPDMPIPYKWQLVSFVSQERSYDANISNGKLEPTSLNRVSYASPTGELEKVTAEQKSLLDGTDGCFRSTPSARLATSLRQP